MPLVISLLICIGNVNNIDVEFDIVDGNSHSVDDHVHDLGHHDDGYYYYYYYHFLNRDIVFFSVLCNCFIPWLQQGLALGAN